MLTLTLALALAAPVRPTATLPDGAAIVLELAQSDQERALGLMYRDSLSADRGMLFVFPADDVYPFWMKNTFIALDLVWLSASGEVVEVRGGVPPCRLDPCPSYQPAKPGRAVLEVNAGVAAAHGLRPGARVRFAGVPGYPQGGGKP